MVVGVNNLLDCLELNTPNNVRDVEDLIRIERRQLNSNNNDNVSSTSQFYYLMIDVDSTLERLYGGFHSDWLAGGEWTHLYSYMISLLKTCQDLSLCLIFCFDGTLYRYSRSAWYHEQIQQRKKVNQIFKHLKQNKSGLPRRHLWLAPAALQLCLRMILREFNSPHMIIYQTWGYGECIHREQVQKLAIKYGKYLLGIVSSDFEFLLNSIGDNQKNRLMFVTIFSAKHFKLSLKGKLTLVPIQFSQFNEKFSLDNKQFSLLATLLGNHILSDTDLIHFHNDLLREQDSSKRTSFKTNGTLSPSVIDSSLSETKIDNGSSDTHLLDNSEDRQQTSSVTSPVHFGTQSRGSGGNTTFDQLIPRLVDYVRKQTIESEIDFDSIGNQVFKHLTDDESRKVKIELLKTSYHYYLKALTDNPTHSSFSSHDVPMNKSDDDDGMPESFLNECASTGVNSEVMRTAFDLHKQGSMMSWILQCLYKHEITFPVTIEPEMCNTIPNACEFFRPIRALAYGLLLGHEIIVREQVYNSEHGSYLTEVKGEPLPSMITIEQLWFGTSPDEDRQCRLQTFLQCLRYCDLPNLYSISHDYLLFICILRYIFMEFIRLTSTLQTYELLAFISQAVLTIELQPKPLMNVQTSPTATTTTTNQYDHIQILNYETRPVQLAHLFMRGLETAIFANEVCGAPIHPKYCCVTHFFNGKLFHHKYSQAQYYQQQQQDLMMVLCDGNAHCAQIGLQLLDAILDRSSMSSHLQQTPMQHQSPSQYVIPPQQQQQRIMRYPSSEQVRAPTFLANSIRPPMRVNSNTNQSINQQQTPISNYRQQQQPPPIKPAGHVRNGAPRKNHNASPFDAKNQQPSTRFNFRTPMSVNIVTQQPPAPLHVDQWAGYTSSHLPAMQQQPRSVNTMQPLPNPPLQHQQPINNSFMNPYEDQLMHVQLHQQPPPLSVLGTPTPIPFHPTQFIAPHLQLASFNHLHPPPPFAIATGPSYYQPSPSSTGVIQSQQALTTPYHPHHPQILSGLPPHAPLPPQRTVTFAGIIPATSNNTFPQAAVNRLSPTSLQAQEINLQALQQRIVEQQKQQTPISIQRQLNRVPVSGEYISYDIHHSTSTNGMAPITIQSRHHPSIEHSQLPHGP